MGEYGLISLKTEVDSLDVDKLLLLILWSNGTSESVCETECESDKKGLKKKVKNVKKKIPYFGWSKRLITIRKLSRLKISNITGLMTTAVLNTKTKEIENKIPDLPDISCWSINQGYTQYKSYISQE